MLLVSACFLFPLAMLAGSVNRAVAADDDKEKIKANLAKLSEADRKLAEAQKMCPIEDEPLGSTGVPIKLTVKGQVVFICCGGCKDEVEKDPEKTLKKVEELKKKNAAKK
jgi:hypothetical protein